MRPLPGASDVERRIEPDAAEAAPYEALYRRLRGALCSSAGFHLTAEFGIVAGADSSETT